MREPTAAGWTGPSGRVRWRALVTDSMLGPALISRSARGSGGDAKKSNQASRLSQTGSIAALYPICERGQGLVQLLAVKPLAGAHHTRDRTRIANVLQRIGREQDEVSDAAGLETTSTGLAQVSSNVGRCRRQCLGGGETGVDVGQ